MRVMRLNASPESLKIWKTMFPDQIPDRLVIAEELNGNVIDLEGHELAAVELGHTDTDSTTCLNVPSIGLVVAGDAAYMMSTFTSPSQMRRHGGSGSPRSTKLSPSTHAQLSHHISDLKTTTIPESSKRPDNTFAISIG